jgi:hypothetical protein
VLILKVRRRFADPEGEARSFWEPEPPMGPSENPTSHAKKQWVRPQKQTARPADAALVPDSDQRLRFGGLIESAWRIRAVARTQQGCWSLSDSNR